jgi:hypothetical protein
MCAKLSSGTAGNLREARLAFVLNSSCAAPPIQQPRQIPLIRSFMMASSALMVSTYFELSVR